MSKGSTISEKAKQRWADPEFKKQVSDKMKAFWADKANKKRMSEAATLSWVGRDDRREAVSQGVSKARKGKPLTTQHKAAIKLGLASSPLRPHPTPRLTRAQLSDLATARREAKWHLCQCKEGCPVIVKSEALYARGHSPASHTEERQLKATKTIVSRFLAGELTNPSGDANVSKRPEVRAKISAALTGVPKSEEANKKLSEYRKLHPLTGHLGTGMLGKQHSEQTKALMSLKAIAVRQRKTWISHSGPSKYPAWNKGLTKETDSRVAAYAEKLIGHPIWAWGDYPYKGYIMRSTWEVAFAIYLDSLNLEWQYEPRWFPVGVGPWEGVTYRPDFFIPATKTYVEIKGAWLQGAKEKVAAFRKRFPRVRLSVLLGEELMAMDILGGDGKVPFKVEKL